MRAIIEEISDGRRILFDGALGTQLMARGVRVQDCLEACNLERPELLRDIAALYVEAGSDVVTTNTFGASPLKLAAYGLADRSVEINRAAVEAVREAVGDGTAVAGSVGPTGAILKPYGDTEPEAVGRAFETQIGALAEAGVDVIAVETMIDLAEARLAVTAAKAIAPTVPVMASMTFDPTPRGFFTTMGVTVDQAVDGLGEAGADIIGSNCGNGIDTMLAIARELLAHSKLPVAIQSNAGLPELRDGVLSYPESPSYMAERIGELVAVGVAVIGGCCGTGAEHIRAFRRVLEAAL